jgi:hypothetical protein
MSSDQVPLKDDRLADLAAKHNVAIFASFGPGAQTPLRHAVWNDSQRCASTELADVVVRLLTSSRSKSLNIRTFRPGDSKSTPFVYGLSSSPDVISRVRSFATEGLYTIVNETIDIHDGGVSGVSLGGVAEFAPDATPRAVEADDFISLPLGLANRILSRVYDVPIELPSDLTTRYEFSVHPARVGHRRAHVCLWESEPVEPADLKPELSWPNHFSRLIGDKTFGLLLAHELGFAVPDVIAVGRRVAPFRFGSPTGSGERWLRTAPATQDPGKFTTVDHWQDPFTLLASEDPERAVAAVLSQEAVPATYSGATFPRDGGDDLIEGVRGRGDGFMLGESESADLPADVTAAVRQLLAAITARLGPVRLEWGYDGSRVWVLQLNRVGSPLPAGVLSPGNASGWLDYDPATSNLDTLRRLVREASAEGRGVLVTGKVGVTSHVGDILRKAGVPGRFAQPVSPPTRDSPPNAR